MAPTTVLAASVAAFGLLLGGASVWALATSLPEFWDPCHEWDFDRGMEDGGSHTSQPTDECPMASGTSETRAEAAFRLAAVYGVTILASSLAIAAAWRRNGQLALGAGLLMAAESVLLFFGLSVTFFVAAAAAVLYLVAAARWRRDSQAL